MKIEKNQVSKKYESTDSISGKCCGKRQRIPIPFIANWEDEMLNSKEGLYCLRIGLNWQSTSKHSPSNRMVM